MRRISISMLLCAGVVLALPTRAMSQVFFDRSVFLSAIGSTPTRSVDFDDIAAGTDLSGTAIADVQFELLNVG